MHLTGEEALEALESVPQSATIGESAHPYTFAEERTVYVYARGR